MRAGSGTLLKEAVHPMVFTYADRRKTEAFLLARTENKLRVAIPGSDDPLELTEIRDTWVTEDCEPVRVEFAWQSRTGAQILTEADCICSHDLAARLLCCCGAPFGRVCFVTLRAPAVDGPLHGPAAKRVTKRGVNAGKRLSVAERRCVAPIVAPDSARRRSAAPNRGLPPCT